MRIKAFIRLGSGAWLYADSREETVSSTTVFRVVGFTGMMLTAGRPLMQGKYPTGGS